MKGMTAGLIAILVIVWSAVAIAEPPEITVGEINIPDLHWGKRTASFEITNNTDWVKFISVETEISFKGHYLNPRRHAVTNYPLEPQFTQAVTPIIDIPANFGEANLTIRVYDMVDTLDPLTNGTLVLEQPFKLKFHIPGELTPYLQEKLSVPPLAGNARAWDNEFGRVLALLLWQGKSVPEIARMAETDTTVINQSIQQMTDIGYIAKNDSGFTFTFPIISADEAEEGKKLADQVSIDLAATITKNLAVYRQVLDSLVKSGAIPKDSNDFMSGSGVLYYPYPVTGGLALWFNLGQKFVTNGVPMAIYAGSDPCNAATRYYMYMTQGGDVVNGHHYYSVDPEMRKLSFYWGDAPPRFNCDKVVYDPAQPLKQGAGWSYQNDMIPEIFMIDTARIATGYRSLLRDTDPIMESALTNLKSIADKYGHTKNTLGIRYWFWNLCASQTLDRLVKSGALTRRGNGQFKFASMK